MKKIMKLFGLTFLVIVAVCGSSYLTDKTAHSNWKITNNSTDKNAISWAKFEWNNGTLNGKYFEKTSMNIPCKLEGFSNVLTFQFDLGANLTGVYENTFSSFYSLNNDLESRVKRHKSRLQFWNNNKIFQNFKISFGNYSAANREGYVYPTLIRFKFLRGGKCTG